MAQQAERRLGKAEIGGSNPLMGSINNDLHIDTLGQVYLKLILKLR